MAKKDHPIKADVDAEATQALSEFKFKFILQVTNPFGAYLKGALIISDEAIQAVIDGGNMPNCNRISRP